jgi:hypothetical protein
MTGRSFKTLFLRDRARSVALTVAMVLVALIVHTITARAYYSLNSQNLQLVASIAVRAGAEYLPTDPQAAMRIAGRFVQRQGVASDEIISTDVSADNYTLTIRLRRKVPKYVSLLALGLPSRLISVTVSGQRQKLEDPPGHNYWI